MANSAPAAVEADAFLPGNGEPIFTGHGGLRFQYHWNPVTREHAYYCFQHDIFYRDWETLELL